MAIDLETLTQDASVKIGLLASLFSQPGDLVLDENDKAGLVNIFYDVIEKLEPSKSV